MSQSADNAGRVTASTPTPTSPSHSRSSSAAGAAANSNINNLNVMMEGRKFERYFYQPTSAASTSVSSPPMPPVLRKESILLWYEPSSSNHKLGTFYWSSGVRQKVTNQQMSLSSITDVFLGRWSQELKDDFHQNQGQGRAELSVSRSTSSASSTSSKNNMVEDEECFSLVSKKVALHLRAESAAIRAAYLDGIRYVHARTQQLLTEAALQTSNITFMINGAHFTSLSTVTSPDSAPPRIEKENIFLWFEPNESKLGTLRWCASEADAAQQSRQIISNQSIQMHRISDVYLGKQVSELKGAETQGTPSQCCFSVIAKDRALHLIAASEQERTQILDGIKEIFASVGKRSAQQENSQSASSSSLSSPRSKNASVDKTSNKGAEVLPAAAATAAVVASESSPSEADASATKVNPLVQGQRFTSFEGAEQTVAYPIVLWYDPKDGKLGTLYYARLTGTMESATSFPASAKVKSEECSIPFSRISDIFTGQQTPELRSQAAENYPSSVCFSIASKNRSLHLAAVSEEARVEFLSNIKQVFISNGKKVETERAAKKKSKPSSAAPSTSSSRRTSLIEGLAPLPDLRSELLEQGHSFISYETHINDAQETEIIARPIFLFYVGNGAQLGSLHWNAASSNGTENDKVAYAERSIPMSLISDILVGKLSPFLEELSEQQAVASCCFSLQTSPALSPSSSLHLQAQDSRLRTAWLDALRTLFVAAGKRTQQETLETLFQQTLIDHPQRALLIQGAFFTTYTREKLPSGEFSHKARETLLWYAPEDAKLGTLHWSFTGERVKYVDEVTGATPQSLPCHRVTDIILGKQTAALTDPALKEMPSNRCFSILTKDRELHASAPTAQQRTDWLEAIKSLFVESGKKVDDETKVGKATKSKKESESALVASAARSADVQPLPSASESKSEDPLAEGREYIMLNLDVASGDCTSTPVYVFYELDNADPVGRLYWCPPGTRQKVQENSLPMSKIQHVYLGRHTAEFKSPQGQSFESKQCVSVVSDSLAIGVHLVARNEAARDELVAALRTCFARAAKPSVDLSDPAAVQTMLCDGDFVTSYIGTGSIGTSTRAYLWYEPPSAAAASSPTAAGATPSQSDGSKARSKLGTLYWNENVSASGQQKEKQGEMYSLQIAHITDVFVNKKSPELLSVEGLFANGDHCLSIMTKKNSLHVEFSTQAIRDAWLLGIKNAYANGGKIVRESKPGSLPGTRITTIVSARQVAKVSPVLLEGRAFVRYLWQNGQLLKPVIFMWLVRDDPSAPSATTSPAGSPRNAALAPANKLGVLYWEPKVKTGQTQPRVARADCSVPVNTIKDVYIGKQTQLFAHGELSVVPADCCLSIASTQFTLDLATKYERDRKEWLTALRTVFISSGRKVLEDEQKVTKITLDAPVWTPYGEGLAARYPRSDGIMAVQLDYGIAYLHASAIHHLVQVMTPLGMGVLLPFAHPLVRAKAAADAEAAASAASSPSSSEHPASPAGPPPGTLPVQLAWGIAYVAKRDIKPLKTTSAPASRDVSPRTSQAGTPLLKQTPTAAGAVPVMASSTPSTSAIAAASVAPIRPIQTQFSRSEATRILRQEFTFSLHHHSLPIAQKIVVTLVLDETPLGILQYRVLPDESTTSPSSPAPAAVDSTAFGEPFIAVHTITDLILGSSRFPFYYQQSAANAPQERALSIIARHNRVWHLLSRASHEKVARWFYALHSLIRLSGKDILTDTISTNSSISVSDSGTSSSSTNTASYAYQKPNEPELHEAIATLEQGASMVQHVVTLPSSANDHRIRLSSFAVFFWYESTLSSQQDSLGSLFTVPMSAFSAQPELQHFSNTSSFTPEQIQHRNRLLHSSAPTEWKLTEMRDLFLGSSHFRKSLPLTHQIDHNSCFSILLRDRNELNLEAKDKRARDAFFHSIVSILKHSPDQEEEYDDDEEMLAIAQVANNAAPATENSSHDVQKENVHEVSNASTTLEEKPAQRDVSRLNAPSASPSFEQEDNPKQLDAHVMIWTGDADHAEYQPQFMFWDRKSNSRKRLGSLYWCGDNEDRVKIAGQELPLSSISDVYLGKNSPAFKSPQASAVASNHCFVLVSKTQTLSCQMSSNAEREAWMSNFRALFKSKQVVDAAGNKRTSNSATPRPDRNSSSVIASRPSAEFNTQ